MLFDLTGKVALITGATGGIGSAIAKALHKQGAEIAISGTRTPVLAKLAQELAIRTHIFSCNLLDQQMVEDLIPNVERTLGQVDILINNAGIVRDALLMRMSDEAWNDVITVNLESSFRLMRAVSKVMLRKKWGRIINITSVVGITGNAGQANYTSSKAGLIGLTKTAAIELATRGITVNCIAPGYVTSAMTENLAEDQKRKLQNLIPIGRAGTPEEIASAAVFLSSNEASYITGTTLHVNGGMAMF